MSIARPANVENPILRSLNGPHHRALLVLFMVVVIAHWSEHVSQATQIWTLGWKPAQARGVLGLWFPVLITSEWLHYGYALLMLLGLWTLRHGFVGRSRRLWGLALKIQIWHHFEHLLLLVQALTGKYLFGAAVPTSVLQLLFPRVELHLFYNAIVFIPMVIAVVLHMRPRAVDQTATGCSCLPAASTTVPVSA